MTPLEAAQAQYRDSARRLLAAAHDLERKGWFEWAQQVTDFAVMVEDARADEELCAAIPTEVAK